MRDVPHFEEDVAELFADFEQWVQRATVRWETFGLEVVLFEFCGFPRAAGEHVGSQVCLKLLNGHCELRALGYSEPQQLALGTFAYEPRCQCHNETRSRTV